MLVTRRQRAYLTEVQVEVLAEWDDALRCVHNAALEERRRCFEAYKRNGQSDFISYESQANQLPEIRGMFDWVKAVPAQVVQQMLMDVDTACRKHGVWKVKFWAKHQHAPSFRYPTPKHTPAERLNKRWGQVFLPKLGWVKFRWTRPMTGTLKRLTLKQDGTHWYIAFLYDTEVPAPDKQSWYPGQSAGVDVGVVNALVVVDVSGDPVAFDRNFTTPSEAERLLRLLRQQSRRRRTNPVVWRTSRNYQHTQQQIRELYARQRRRRRDFHNQIAAALTTTYPFIAHENLNIPGMTRSTSGTLDEPGVNVTQKRGLNRAILDKGWGMFADILAWHAYRRGTHSFPTPAHHTSQKCPLCQRVAAENRESQAVFRCVACGFTAHADVVGAWNTRERGVKLASTPGHPHPGAATRVAVGRQAAPSIPLGDNTLGVGGDSALAGSVKRQPLRLHTYKPSV